MNIDLFKIQKKVDVHQLKKSLWNYINPKIAHEKRDDEDAQMEQPEVRPLKLADILSDMYETGEVNQQHVSVNSAFICMLHLANEKNLEFVAEGPGEDNFEVR